jgi:hypothetical protein
MWCSPEEVIDRSEVVAVGSVEKIERVAVGDRAWLVATIAVEKVLLDRSPKDRELKTLELYLRPAEKGPFAHEMPGEVKKGQRGIWLFEAPADFVGYRMGHFSYHKAERLKRVEAVIAAERDPAAAMRSKSARDRLSGAYFWWSAHGRKDPEGRKVARKASKEATALVMDAVCTGLDADDYEQSQLARKLVWKLAIKWKDGGGRKKMGERLRAWWGKNSDFRLTEYAEPEPTQGKSGGRR